MFLSARLLRQFHLVLAALLLSACAISPITRAASQSADSARIEPFVAQLTAALQERDYAQLQAMMGSSFTLSWWHAEDIQRPPAIALIKLRDQYLGAGSALSFAPPTALDSLLESADSAALGEPDANVVERLYVTGLGADQRAEAILLIAREDEGMPYWYGILLADGGFQAAAAPILASVAPLTTVIASSAVVTETTVAASATAAPALTMPITAALVPMVDAAGAVTVTTAMTTTDSSMAAAAAAALTATTPMTVVNAVTVTTITTPTGAITETLTATATAPTTTTQLVVLTAAPQTTLLGVVQPDAPQAYRLPLTAGGTLSVELASAAGAAEFTVVGMADNRTYKQRETHAQHWQATVPTTQDYLITVSAPNALPYELTIGVTDDAMPASTTTSAQQAAPQSISFVDAAAQPQSVAPLPVVTAPQYALRQAPTKLSLCSSPRPAPVEVLLTSAGGAVIARAPLSEPLVQLAVTLPISGDYLVTLTSPGATSEVDYTVTFAVE